MEATELVGLVVVVWCELRLLPHVRRILAWTRAGARAAGAGDEEFERELEQVPKLYLPKAIAKHLTKTH